MGEGTAVPAAKEEQHSKLPFPLEKARDIFINGGVRIIVTIAGFYLSIIAFALTALNVLKKKNITGLVSSPKDRPLPPQVLTAYGKYKYVQLPNEWMFYVQNGNVDAPLMILLHGFPDFWFSWREQINHYAEHYKVVAVDLRGYGNSEKYLGFAAYDLDALADDLKNLIENLSKDKKPVVMAHDWGAVILYHFLLKYPTLIEKYVAISIFPLFAFSVNIKQILQFWYIIFFQIPILPELFLKQYDLDSPFLKQLYQKQTDEVIESYKFTFSKAGSLQGPLAYYRSNIVLLLKYLIFGANYKSKPLPPGLVLYGDKDFTSNPASYKNVKKVPNLVSREIKGGSHFLHQQSAIEVNQYIDEFLYGSADKPATPTTVT